ncbi:MAG: MarR family transcriptional regulator [Chloroflexi bacterium]|nr:MarR family transcriptional regulator [Chloroflexota bacterium]
MRTNNDSGQDTKTLVRHILKSAEDIYRTVKLSVPPEWLTSDMTVAQLRVLLTLHADGPSQMSSIAASIEVAVSTATGIMDNLVRKGLVTRGDDTEDRRLVICTLSPQGQETINRVWTLGQFQMEKLLRGLSVEQLKKADEVAGFLLTNVTSKSSNSV